MFEETEHLVNSSNSSKHDNHHDRGISEWETAASLAKAIMGAGSFALPWAFSNMGYVAGPIFMTLLMVLSVYSLNILVQCSRAGVPSQQQQQQQNHSYVEVARASFGMTGAWLAYIASVSASIGVCGSYLVFIVANLQSLLLENSAATLSQGSILLFVLPLAVVLSSVRDMKRFAFASLLGDVSVVLGMAVVLVYGLFYHKMSKENCVAVGSLDTMPLAFGAIGYLFLIHFLVLPIESSMKNPERFSAVATKTFAACAVLSGSFGVIGYLLFGAETNQIVLLNVQGSFFVSAVKLLLCVDLLLTYPVVMRPSIVIVEQSLLPNILPSPSKAKSSLPAVGWNTHLAVCVFLGLVAGGSSLYVPAFGLLSGLVGGVSQTFLAFVFPPLMLSQKQNPKGVLAISGKHVCLVMLGSTLIMWTLVSTWNELGGGKVPENQMGTG